MSWLRRVNTTISWQWRVSITMLWQRNEYVMIKEWIQLRHDKGGWIQLYCDKGEWVLTMSWQRNEYSYVMTKECIQLCCDKGVCTAMLWQRRMNTVLLWQKKEWIQLCCDKGKDALRLYLVQYHLKRGFSINIMQRYAFPASSRVLLYLTAELSCWL